MPNLNSPRCPDCGENRLQSAERTDVLYPVRFVADKDAGGFIIAGAYRFEYAGENETICESEFSNRFVCRHCAAEHSAEELLPPGVPFVTPLEKATREAEVWVEQINASPVPDYTGIVLRKLVAAIRAAQ